MAFICGRSIFFRGNYSNTCKNRCAGYGFASSDGTSDNCGFDLLVADGIFGGISGYDPGCVSEDADILMCIRGDSWICYFHALQIGNVNQVVPIDKSSVILTILLGVIFLKEPMNLMKAGCVVLIAVGTFLMIEKKNVKETDAQKSRSALIYAALSAIFASLTALLSKIGIVGIESNLGTAIRTIIVLLMAWMIVLARGKQKQIRTITKKSWIFIVLSGISTGLSWLCYYRALQDGPISVVLPIDKLSILVSIGFAYVVFGEKLTRKSAAGLVLIVVGTLGMVI